MPTTESLPFAIRGLSRHQAIKLSEDRWEYDFGKLAEALEGGTASTKAAKKNRIRCFCDRPPGGDRRLWQFRDSAPDLSGRWTAEVPYEFGTPRREAFVFVVSGKSVRGRASFLGVARAIEEGAIDGAVFRL
jgi:hypothetical protein